MPKILPTLDSNANESSPLERVQVMKGRHMPHVKDYGARAKIPRKVHATLLQLNRCCGQRIAGGGSRNGRQDDKRGDCCLSCNDWKHIYL